MRIITFHGNIYIFYHIIKSKSFIFHWINPNELHYYYHFELATIEQLSRVAVKCAICIVHGNLQSTMDSEIVLVEDGNSKSRGKGRRRKKNFLTSLTYFFASKKKFYMYPMRVWTNPLLTYCTFITIITIGMYVCTSALSATLHCKCSCENIIIIITRRRSQHRKSARRIKNDW